jgi:hypothetical protein
MNETTENFFKALDQWKHTNCAHLLFYRLYYDQLGQPVCYSMEDLPGNYIEITAEQFAQSSPHMRVVDGKLVLPPAPCPPTLVPSDQGTACAVEDVAVVVSDTQPHTKWKLVTYR